MIKISSDVHGIQHQFKDVNALLMNVMDSLSRSGNPIVSRAIQDMTNISQGLQKLEQDISDEITSKQHQLQALREIGSVINSSLGKKRVLEEVMDSLIRLMRAERG